MDPTDANTLAMAAPMSVPATPNVEEMRAAETAASVLAATWMKLGRVGRVCEGPDPDDAMTGVQLLLF